MRARAPEHDGGAPVAGVVFAVVVAVNVAAGSAALDERLEGARSALGRAVHTVAAVVAGSIRSVWTPSSRSTESLLHGRCRGTAQPPIIPRRTKVAGIAIM